MERMALLAGLSPTAQKGGRQRTVAALFFQSARQDIRAGLIQGLSTPAAIGAALKAGTNCGSCIPELKKLLGAMAPSAVN